jgi:hypothetical protein
MNRSEDLTEKESMMSYFPEMQKGNLDSAKSDAHGKIKKGDGCSPGGLRDACDFRCRREMVK